MFILFDPILKRWYPFSNDARFHLLDSRKSYFFILLAVTTTIVSKNNLYLFLNFVKFLAVFLPFFHLKRTDKRLALLKICQMSISSRFSSVF